MAPVRSDDPIGAIGAYWAQTYEATPEEVDTLETLSRATATAIDVCMRQHSHPRPGSAIACAPGARA